MPVTRLFAFGLAMMSGVAAAHAQTVITRQISEEPVETTITQSPYGTVITRRPLDTPHQRVIVPGYGVPGYVNSGYGTVRVRSLSAPAIVIEEADTDEDVVEPVRVRRTQAARSAAPAAQRRASARRGNPPVMARAVEPEPRSAARVRPAGAPLELRPAQREIIYRTIVSERVYGQPQAVSTGYYGAAPVSPQVVGYVAWPFGVVANLLTYALGAPVPQTVALAVVPPTVAVQVPVIRGYRYVVVNNRVLLVDPATNIIVAEVTP
ncbi:MAG: DUF1236 domain-containing protein [Rhodoplanes sp.]